MIIQDLFKTILSVLSVIVIIIVSRKFIKVLNQAIEGNISNETVISILGLKTIVAINTFLPASIFIAILMIIGRMYRDQEMSAIASAGGGAGVIYRSVYLLVIPLCFVAGWLSMVATPWAEAEMVKLMHEDKQEADIQGISAGRFSEYSHGELVFYTEHIDKTKRMHNVFVQTRSDNGLGIITAKFGRIKQLPEGLYLVLSQGERIQNEPGLKQSILESFDEYAVRIDKRSVAYQQQRDGTPTENLWHSNDPGDIAEIQNRLSIPLGVIFLSFLAVPLAKLSPRGGVYGSLIIAFAIYFVYGNLKRVSHSWVANETIPPSVGYIGIYILLFGLGCLLLIRLYGLKWVLSKYGIRNIE